MVESAEGARRASHWMIGAYVGGVLLHLGQVPLWVIIVACGGAAWALAEIGRAHV